MKDFSPILDVMLHLYTMIATHITNFEYNWKLLLTLGKFCNSLFFMFEFSLILLFCQALFDLEQSNQELKSDLKDLYINSAV